MQFTLSVSYNLDGASELETFTANSAPELDQRLFQLWKLHRISNDRDEAFLDTTLSIGDVEYYLDLGTFTCIDNQTSHSNQKPEYQNEPSRWPNVGFDVDQYEELDDMYPDQIDFIFNPNSPIFVLGQWLVEISKNIQNDIDDFFSLPDQELEVIGKQMLGSVIRFGAAHNKTLEILKWLQSDVGQNFLSGTEEFDYIASFLNNELSKLELDDAKTSSLLSAISQSYKSTFPYFEIQHKVIVPSL